MLCATLIDVYTLEVMQGPAFPALQTVGFLGSCAAGTGTKARRTYQMAAVALCLKVAKATLATGLAPIAGLAVTVPAAPSSPFPFTLPVATAGPLCAPRTWQAGGTESPRGAAELQGI